MKAKEIIIKESNTNKIEEIMNTFTLDKSLVRDLMLIGKNCKPFLKEINYDIFNYSLFRGLNSEENFIQSRVRLSDRKPRDTDINVHNAINKYFVEKFGEPFRNALFATGDVSVAVEYGDVYFIFPVGDFTFCWSTEIEDLLPISEELEDDIEEILNTLKNGNYSNTNLLKAINSDNEIMIRSQSVYCIKLDRMKVITDEKKAIIEILRLS